MSNFEAIYEFGRDEPVAYLDTTTHELLMPWEVPWSGPPLPKNYAEVPAE